MLYYNLFGSYFDTEMTRSQ